MRRADTVRAVMVAVALATTLASARPASACPNCAAGREARSDVWNEDFGLNFIIALLPFLVIGAICARVERIGLQHTARAEHSDTGQDTHRVTEIAQ